jgi:uncharacterized membrane protein YedE/YeeE
MTSKSSRSSKSSHLVAFASGLLFAIGLGLAGMTNPNKVLGFLDVFGDWDPSLALVMAGAILVYAPAYHRLAGTRFQGLSRKHIDSKLIVGAIVFGIGWGIAGYCPGPAIVATATGTGPALAFFAAMLVGMLAHKFIVGRNESER